MESVESIRTTNRPQGLNVQLSFGDRLLIFEKAAHILSNHEDSKNAEDTKSLADCLDLLDLMQEYKTNLPEPIYKDLLKKCTEYLKLETYDPGEILFYHKSEIDRIIVVARGCIDLYEPKSNEELLAEISEIQEILFKNKTQNAHEIIRELEDTRQALLDKKYYNSPKYQRSIPQKAARVMSMFQALWGYQVLREPTHDKEAHMFFDKEINSSLKYLDSGLTKVKKVTSQTLGYSLLKPEEVKNETLYPYTAVASVPSQVIVIEKDKYLKVFETLKVKLEAKWKFFGDYLENKTAKIVKNFYKAFKERTFKKNQRIFQQDDLCNEVYAVAQGEVELFKPMEREKPLASNMLSELRRDSNNDCILGVGRMFGELDSHHVEHHQCTAIAKEDDTILYVANLKDYLILKQQFKMILRKVRDKFENAGDAVSRSNTDSRDDMSDFSIISTHRFDEDFDRPNSKSSQTRENNLLRNVSPLYKGSSFKPKVEKAESLNNSVNIIEDAQIDEFNQLLQGTAASKPSKELEQALSKFAIPTEKVDTAISLYPTRELSAGQVSDQQILEPELEKQPSPEPYGFVRHNSFQKLMKQKVSFFEKKLKNKTASNLKISTPTAQRPFEVDIMKMSRKFNKTSQAVRINKQMNPSPSANQLSSNQLIIESPSKKKLGVTIQDFKKSLADLPSGPTHRSQVGDLSVSGSQYRKTGIKIDTKAAMELDGDDNTLENYVTPSHYSIASGSKKHLTTTEGPSQMKEFAPLHGMRSTESLHSHVKTNVQTQNRFYISDFKPNMASLELAAPFSKKKVPLMLSMNYVKTLDTVKAMKTIFKKPGFISPDNLTLKEIQVNPDTIRGSNDQTPIMRKTFTSTNHNMFRIKPTRLHIAMSNYKSTGL